MKKNDKTDTRNTNRDLTDSPRDEERLKPDEAIIDLPEVKDIPGQEFIHPPALGELADTTISSDDEEGTGLFDEENGMTEQGKNNSTSLNSDENNTNNENPTLGIP